MTVRSTKDAINLRAKLAALKARPNVLPRRFDFANLVTNGVFSADSDWTKGTGWTIGSGVATKAAGTASQLAQSLDFGARNYLLGFTVSGYSAGSLTPQFTGGSTVNATARSANGTYTEALQALQNTTLALYGNATFAGSVDDVYLWEADPSDDAPWLRLPHGLKVGYYGQVVCDGTVLHPSDYEEITDGTGQWFIKPTTAPGVSTEYSVWGVLA